MLETELMHYGRKGQKKYQHIYGVWQKQAKYAGGQSDPNAKEKPVRDSDAANKKPLEKKRTRDLSMEELQNRINRLTKEKEYKRLLSEVRGGKRKAFSAAKSFIADVVSKSGKNIATQYVTYWLGTAVNKASGKEVVNPKKGQKDK